MTSIAKPGAPAGRANRMARARASGAGVRELLAFRLGDETYALPLASVREILRPPPITEVPRAARDVLGIVSVRGRITTVIDLRRRLRMPETPPTKLARVLVVDSGDELFGLLVDAVSQVHRLLDDEMEPAASAGADLADYVVGIARPSATSRTATAHASAVEGREERAPAGIVRGAIGGKREELLVVLDPKSLLRR